MELREKMVRKLSQSTTDKIELNKKALQWKKAFGEVDQILNNKKAAKK